MAIQIKKIEAGKPHRCLDELGAGILGDGTFWNYELAPGLISRCSCGTLWKTKKHLYSFTIWKKAGPWLRYKHRLEGWDDIERSDY